MKPRPALVIAMAALATGLVLPLTGAAAADHVIDMKGLSFIPEEIQIAVNDSLTWINHDTDKHDPVGDGGEFESPILLNGEKYTHTFDQPGTIPYHCKIHTYMRGTITVGDGKAPEGAPPKPATTQPGPSTTTTAPFPPALVPYPSAITPP